MLKEKSFLVLVIVFSIISVFVISTIIYDNYPKENALITEIKQNIRADLKDPNSAEFRNVFITSVGHICGEVNAKNSFGAYTGFKRFFATSPDLISIEGVIYDSASFQELLEILCK